MSNGTLEIAIKQPRPRMTSRRGVLQRRGKMFDAYRLSFQPHESRSCPIPQTGRIAEQDGYLEEHSAVRLLGPRVELA